MARRPLPSFSGILLYPNAPHLPLPHPFVQKHLENKIPENPILLSVNGGYSWRLRIEKVGENYCFADGWDNVVEDSHLEFGDFLVFWLIDQSTFKLSIYSPSGCQKDFPVETDDGNDDEVDEEKEELAEIKVGEKDEEEAEEDDDYNEFENDEDEEEEFEEDEDEYDDDGEEDDDGDEDDDGGGDVDGDDGDPFFMAVISKSHERSMRLPVEFTRLVGIDSSRSVTVKNMEGNEWKVKLLSHSRHYASNKSDNYVGKNYKGWSEFKRVNELCKGDECVFTFIRSEDKLCLAKVTKKRVPAKPPAGKAPVAEVLEKPREREQPPSVEKKTLPKKPAGKDFPFEYDDVNEEEEEEDDDDDDDEEEEEEEEDDDGGTEEEDDDDGGGGGDIDGDDGDPFFQAVIPKFDSCRMRLPLVFARLAGIDAKRSIRMKNLDGKEWPMKLLIERHNYTKRHNYTRYYLSAGWSKFKKDNRLSLGDVCVIKFIRSQDKLYLAKLTKKRRAPPAGKVPVTDVPKRPRGRPRRVVVGSKDDGPKMVKRPRGRPRRKEDGHVKLEGVGVAPAWCREQSENSKLAINLPKLAMNLSVRSNSNLAMNLSASYAYCVEDEALLMWVLLGLFRARKNLCKWLLAPSLPSPSSCSTPPPLTCHYQMLLSASTWGTRSPRTRPSGCERDFPFKYDDVNEEDDDKYDGGGTGGDMDGDPFFRAVISKYHKYAMRIPVGFAKLAGIDAERSIRMKNLDGKEWPMKLLPERHNFTKRCNYTRYYLSAGWSKFRKYNQISEGDVCVIKFIKSQDKLCLAKLTKKTRVPPAGKHSVMDVPKRPRGQQPCVEVETKDDGPKVVHVEYF